MVISGSPLTTLTSLLAAGTGSVAVEVKATLAQEPAPPAQEPAECARGPLPTASDATFAFIQAALHEDRLCRRAHVNTGLYPIESADEFQRIGCNLPSPIIRSNTYCRETFQLAQSDAEFAGRLAHIAPWFASFDLAAVGLVLAGGAASALMTSDPTDGCPRLYHDFDLFLVGARSDASVRAAVQTLAEHLAAVWRGAITVYRTLGCITFAPQRVTSEQIADEDKENRPSRLVQIILQRYNTAAEILHSFDLGSSAVLWDGAHVWMTALGKLAIYRGANVINLAARYPSYETRLARYYDRGFDIVLADIPAARMQHTRIQPPTNEWHNHQYRLPYMEIHRSSKYCCGSCIATYRIEPLQVSTHASHSGYEHAQIKYGHNDNILLRNARACTDGAVKTEALCAYATYRRGLNLCELEVSFEAGDEFMRAVIPTMADGNNLHFDTLCDLLGPKEAKICMARRCMQGEPLGWLDLATFVMARLAQLRTYNLRIPFSCVPIGQDGGALAGRFARAAISAQRWYGSNLAGDQPWATPTGMFAPMTFAHLMK